MAADFQLTTEEHDWLNNKYWKGLWDKSAERENSKKNLESLITKINTIQKDTIITPWNEYANKGETTNRRDLIRRYRQDLSTISAIIVPGTKDQKKETKNNPPTTQLLKKFTNKDLYKLKDEKPYFRKSYSSLSTYTPLIKCSLSVNDIFENQNQQYFFDIPYNYIKSLKTESTTGDSLNSKLTLSLEDANGSIISILVANLHLMSLSKKTILPKIIIEFGWGGNQTRASFRKNKLKHFKTIPPKEYSIQKTEITYEGLKQRATLTCMQDLSSIDDLLKELTPYAVFKTNVIGQILVINRLTSYLKDNDLIKSKTVEIARGEINPLSEKPSITIKKNTTILLNHFKEIYEGKGPEEKLPYLFKFGTKENGLYNLQIQENGADISVNFFEKWVPIWNRSLFHPYNVFCFILNNFLYTLKKQPDIEVFLIPLFLEKDIIGIKSAVYFDTTDLTFFNDNMKDQNSIAFKMITAGKNVDAKMEPKEKAICPVLKINETEFNESTNWITLLNNFASKVKIATDPKKIEETESLSVTLEYFPVGDTRKDSYDVINKILTESLNKTTKDKQNIINLQNKVAKAWGDNKKIIFIFLGSKSNVFSIKNKPLQKYTVFPNVKPPSKPNQQFFNSGSKNLLDGSFPDVISFQPELNFSSALNATLAQKNFLPIILEKGKEYKRDSFSFFIVEGEKKSSDEISSYLNFFYQKLQNVLYSQDEITFAFNTNHNKWYYDNIENFLFTSSTLTKELISIALPKKFKFNPNNIDANTLKEKAIINGIMVDYERAALTSNSELFGNAIKNSFVKSFAASPGDRTTVSYASFLSKSDDFFRILKRSAYNFQADLKILGEPAFSYLWGSQPFIFLEVNNSDGSPNILLSGVYMVVSFSHDIEGGKFTTTLKLKYDSPYVENFLKNDNFKAIDEAAPE